MSVHYVFDMIFLIMLIGIAGWLIVDLILKLTHKIRRHIPPAAVPKAKCHCWGCRFRSSGYWCTIWGKGIFLDDFCSYGEKKKDKENNS
nr:MAG TPA: FeoB-associated Cys-rich membrane protein [Caudoviricetes sp.]